MAYEDIFVITFGIISIVLGFILLKYIYKIWKSNKNQMDLAVFVLTLTLVQIRLVSIIRDVLAIFSFDLNPYMTWGHLALLDVLYMVYGVVFGWFILFLYEQKRLYTMPLVAGFYIEFYIFLTNDRGPHNMFVTYVAIISAVILLINSIKNRSGLSFSIFVATMIGIPDFYLGLWWITMITPLVLYFVIYLGVSSWFDDKVFYDRAKRKQIQNSWISKMVAK